MTDYYKRGDILKVNLGSTTGSEQGGEAKTVVIQNDLGNKYSHTIIVAVITATKKKELPTHFPLPDLDYLEKDSIILFEQIRTIDIGRIQSYLGTLDEQIMLFADNALAVSVGLKERRKHGLNLTLCSTCAQVFYDSPYHDIHRSDPDEMVKEPCCYCSIKTGYSFDIIPKSDLKK